MHYTIVEEPHPLLGPKDPSPVEIIDAKGASEILVICEHGGTSIPKSLANMGLTRQELASLEIYDIGAAKLARQLALRLNATLVMQNYSRLVVDCSRQPFSAGSISSDHFGVHIAANGGLKIIEREQRVAEVFMPFDDALAKALNTNPIHTAISIRTYPVFCSGQRFGEDINLIPNGDIGTSHDIQREILQLRPDMLCAIHDPSQLGNYNNWFINRYAEPLKLHHCQIEVRQDILRNDEEISHMTELLSKAISTTSYNNDLAPENYRSVAQ